MINNLFNIENNYVIIIIVFLSTIALLIFFAFMIDFVRKKLDKSFNKKQELRDKDKIEAKIYELLYSNKMMSIDDLNYYFNLDIELLTNLLNDMVDKKVIKLEDNKYSLK